MFKRHTLISLTAKLLRDWEPRVLEQGVDGIPALELDPLDVTPKEVLAQVLAVLLLVARNYRASEIRLSLTQGTAVFWQGDSTLEFHSPSAQCVVDLCRRLLKELATIEHAPQTVPMRVNNGEFRLIVELKLEKKDVSIVLSGFGDMDATSRS